jgi:hypothetical protein
MGCVTEYIFDVPSLTHLWVNQRVRGLMADHADGPFMKKLERCCTSGFEFFERGSSPVIRHEGNGVYRIGIRKSLFRLIGFYEDGTGKSNFICLDGFEKSGQALKAPERDRIVALAKIKREKLWSRCPNEQYPRLARYP